MGLIKTIYAVENGTTNCLIKCTMLRTHEVVGFLSLNYKFIAYCQHHEF